MQMKWTAVALAATLVVACGKKEEAAPAATAPAAPVAAAPAAPSGDTVTVRIGHVAPISGAQAHYGKDNENGVRMAIEDLNKQNIQIGGKKATFEIVAEDDAADPKQGTAAAQKLCDSKVAGVVGHLNSGTTIPASKVYNDCGIPHVTGAATNPDLTKPGYKTTYRIIANDLALGAGLAFYAADKLKLKKVAIIDDRSAYGQGVADIFKKTAKEKGMTVVDEQFTTDKATDFMAILTAIKAKNPDAVFYGGMDPQAGPMLRQMEQLGMSKVKYFGGDGICTSEIAKLAGGAKTLENVICAEGGASLAKMPGGVEWKKRYDEKYPNQFQVYSPYTYDATFVLVDAMKRANSIDPKVYTPELIKTSMKGVTTTIEFLPNGELKNPAITLYNYVGGKKTPLE
ncbi:branched-chain amino acid ABC transporter substrate-binding protein [Polaromonas sp. SM01]|uniref:branched-chain amino acid ABC transporter substrate-binding protein n=1 Tax=Polaromonas sp. SM01 TaxID=3085630 RepID=UPI002981F6F8|nr:branched-chain amino acid ABC transporter substrate-binding protein [Polaromonas sp. SM01]MDW5444344.1 branched-chain amino acid ABC transporter substrate-binding protein [Polaromonas sp. SM01]